NERWHERIDCREKECFIDSSSSSRCVTPVSTALHLELRLRLLVVQSMGRNERILVIRCSMASSTDRRLRG
ncbi:hypothetical protein PFISCL1PPCAC_1857, partial [Pristionchus fissidentatus]